MPRFRRGRCRRWITAMPLTPYFQPLGIPPNQMRTINLTPEELEVLRLVDLEGLYQEDAAAIMGISRRTLWNDLKKARKKVVNALVNGYAIRIAGGNYAIHPSFPHPDIRPNRLSVSDEVDNEKVRKIFELFPKTNCGACGYSSCIECAKAIASRDASPDACRIIGSKIKDDVMKILEEGR